MTNPKCPECGERTMKNGKFQSGIPRYRCKCGWFSKSPNASHRPKTTTKCIDCGSPNVYARQRCEKHYRKFMRQNKASQ